MVMPRNVFFARVARWSGAACAVCVALTCEAQGDAPSRARRTAVLTDVATVVVRSRPELVENSAAVMSAQFPGVMYTVNDSGNEPLLFALDTTGVDRGVWRITNATDIDWEAASIGPCKSDPRPRCIYIGDVGDNRASHPSRVIYRVVEPSPRDSSFTGSLAPDSVAYTYPDRAHDVEAMYVAPSGDIYLITKRALRTRFGALRPALLFRIPAAAWNESKNVVAELTDSLPIVPGSVPLRTITDASLSLDGRHLAVRTYGELYIFATDSATARVNHLISPSVCDVVMLGEPQGEGVAWLNSAGRFVFSSEGRTAPLHLASCKLPK